MSGVFLVLHCVYMALQMLDPHPHGKGLGLHRQSPVIEHFHRVPGTVAQGQDHLPGREPVAPLRAGNDQRRQLSLRSFDPLQSVSEAYVRAQVQQPLPQVFQCNVQPVRPHMRPCINEDALRRTAGDQLLQDPPVPQVLGAGVQLSVRKRPGAPFAKLHVGLRV